LWAVCSAKLGLAGGSLMHALMHGSWLRLTNCDSCENSANACPSLKTDKKYVGIPI